MRSQSHFTIAAFHSTLIDSIHIETAAFFSNFFRDKISPWTFKSHVQKW